MEPGVSDGGYCREDAEGSREPSRMCWEDIATQRVVHGPLASPVPL